MSITLTIRATTTDAEIDSAIRYMSMHDHAIEMRDMAAAVMEQQGDQVVLEYHDINGVDVLWSPVFQYAYVNAMSSGVGDSMVIEQYEAKTPEAAAQQWIDAGGATLVSADEWRVTIDHDGAGVVHADSAEQALDLACAMVQRGDYSGDEPVWVDVYVDRGSERAERTVQLDPEPPECQDALGHDWEDVAALGHGGGVIVRERCSHCGVIRVTDTWAQRPDNGVQGYTTVQYESPSDDDLDD